ncbi:hypothetical protein J3F83DRAFT_647457 [Trichoderma novae-zelandiae]
MHDRGSAAWLLATDESRETNGRQFRDSRLLQEAAVYVRSMHVSTREREKGKRKKKEKKEIARHALFRVSLPGFSPPPPSPLLSTYLNTATIRPQFRLAGKSPEASVDSFWAGWVCCDRLAFACEGFCPSVSWERTHEAWRWWSRQGAEEEQRRERAERPRLQVHAYTYTVLCCAISYLSSVLRVLIEEAEQGRQIPIHPCPRNYRDPGFELTDASAVQASHVPCPYQPAPQPPSAVRRRHVLVLRSRP